MIHILPMKLIILLLIFKQAHSENLPDNGECSLENLCESQHVRIYHQNFNYSQLSVDCPKLYALTVTNVNLINFEVGPDFNFTDLNHLDVSYNQIEKFSLNNSSPLPKLRHIDLSFNNLTKATASMFRQCPRLEVLDLSSNNLSVVTFEFSYDLKNLKKINLERNRIETLTDLSFCQLPNLRLLNLENNKLSAVSLAFNLTFSHCEEFFIQLKNNTNLKEIDLNNVGNQVGLQIIKNGANSKPTSVQGFQRLKIFPFVPENETIKSSDLHVLELSGNNIPLFYFKSIINVPSLIELHLQNANMEEIRFTGNSSAQMPNLKVINLLGNKNTYFNVFKNKLPKLKMIYARKGELRDIENICQFFSAQVNFCPDFDPSQPSQSCSSLKAISTTKSTSTTTLAPTTPDSNELIISKDPADREFEKFGLFDVCLVSLCVFAMALAVIIVILHVTNHCRTHTYYFNYA